MLAYYLVVVLPVNGARPKRRDSIGQHPRATDLAYPDVHIMCHRRAIVMVHFRGKTSPSRIFLVRGKTRTHLVDAFNLNLVGIPRHINQSRFHAHAPGASLHHRPLFLPAVAAHYSSKP